MFQAAKALFIYCVSPVHMGAGTSIGVIDNPIQRERHTEYPLMAGSGLKGAVRHQFWSQLDDSRRKDKTNLLNRLFGPETDASDHAGAISFGDAQLVAFPVRSLKRGYVYATSPLALARAARTLGMAGHPLAWNLTVEEGHCRLTNPDLLSNHHLALEAFEFTAHLDTGLRAVAEWLAIHALPASAAYAFFRDKLRDDLVLLSDTDFGYFTRNATVVEPHVRINDESGTADDGGLFYTENLPPESLLLTVAMASVERYRKDKPGDWRTAAEVLDAVVYGRGEGVPFGGLHEQLAQVGGDATTGRGQVLFTAVEG